MSNKKKWSLGLLLTGAAIGAGATIAAILRQKHREQVYHEAELKAMDELDDMMAEDDSACTECEGMDECVPCCSCEDCGDECQISMTENGIPAQEADLDEDEDEDEQPVPTAEAFYGEDTLADTDEPEMPLKP